MSDLEIGALNVPILSNRKFLEILREENLLRRLKIYEIDSNYIKYLSEYQKHLFYSDNDKSERKYIGIILEINDFKYFAPLSSFKEKHKKMKEGVDFIKIKNYAVLNINNMIPVPKGLYYLVDINGIKDQHYKYLLQTESRELNKQRNRIMKNANIVYKHKIRNQEKTSLARRSNDFAMLEKRCREYML